LGRRSDLTTEVVEKKRKTGRPRNSQVRTKGEHNSPKSAPHPSTSQSEQWTVRPNVIDTGVCSDCAWSAQIVKPQAKSFHRSHRPELLYGFAQRWPLRAKALISGRQKCSTSAVFRAESPSQESLSSGIRPTTCPSSWIRVAICAAGVLPE
jgi:hypothetical protein